MQTIWIFAGALFIVSQTAMGADKDRVNLAVYYETHCPDSTAFIREQLWPTYRELGPIISIDLVPYGKADHNVSSGGIITFRCHHGNKECWGNMIESCTIKLTKNIDKSMPFVHCMANISSPELNWMKCASQTGFRRNEVSRIERCIKTSEGPRYLLEEGLKTKSLNPKLNFVPWLTVNGQFGNATHKKALKDLKSVVCQTYKGPQFAKCG